MFFSGMCARSSLKTFGESFINDERYLSSVGGSGSFGAAVGALSMGLIMDMTIGSGKQQPTESSKQPIRALYIGHLTGYQPIRNQYFLVRSVPTGKHSRHIMAANLLVRVSRI